VALMYTEIMIVERNLLPRLGESVAQIYNIAHLKITEMGEMVKISYESGVVCAQPILFHDGSHRSIKKIVFVSHCFCVIRLRLPK
jgi:hypothetical protein